MIPNNFSLDLAFGNTYFWPGGKMLLTSVCTASPAPVSLGIKSPIGYVDYAVVDPATGAVNPVNTGTGLIGAFELDLPAVGIEVHQSGTPDNLQVRVSRIPK